MFPFCSLVFDNWRRRADSNRRIELLQSSALTTWLRRLDNTILPCFWCRGGDLNSYGFAPTAPSRPRVYQFHHLGTVLYILGFLAGVGGFEPPTYGFGDRCSNRAELHSCTSYEYTPAYHNYGTPARTRTGALGLGNRCSIRLSYRGTPICNCATLLPSCRIPGKLALRLTGALSRQGLPPVPRQLHQEELVAAPLDLPQWDKPALLKGLLRPQVPGQSV